MIDIGVVCLKIAGRDAGKTCVVVDKLDDIFVIIDGETRRRKCNIRHIEPTGKKLKIKKGATTAEVRKALASEGITFKEKKDKKTKTKTEKPKPQRKVKAVKQPKEEKKKVTKKKDGK